MGLNNTCFGWCNQVEYFSKLPSYEVLTFDNRGVGNSDSPNGIYKTTDMAGDVIELLDFLGWKEKRSVHAVGVSMGGMISQHLVSMADISFYAPFRCNGPVCCRQRND